MQGSMLIADYNHLERLQKWAKKKKKEGRGEDFGILSNYIVDGTDDMYCTITSTVQKIPCLVVVYNWSSTDVYRPPEH